MDDEAPTDLQRLKAMVAQLETAVRRFHASLVERTLTDRQEAVLTLWALIASDMLAKSPQDMQQHVRALLPLLDVRED